MSHCFRYLQESVFKFVSYEPIRQFYDTRVKDDTHTHQFPADNPAAFPATLMHSASFDVSEIISARTCRKLLKNPDPIYYKPEVVGLSVLRTARNTRSSTDCNKIKKKLLLFIFGRMWTCFI